MKPMLTRLLALAELAFLTLALAGCWDSSELKEQAFASMLAIDKGEKLRYRLTLQVPKPASPTEPGGSGPSFTVFSQEGQSLSECIPGMTAYMSRRPNLSHLKLIAVGEEVAKSEGLEDLVNLGHRSLELRTTTVLALAQGRAEDLAAIQPAQEKGPSTYYEDLFAQSYMASVTYPTTLHEVIISALKGASSSPVVPFLVPKVTGAARGEDGAPAAVTTAGTAMFRDNKYVGRMSEYETQGWLLITGRMRSAVVPVRFAGGRVVSVIRDGSATTSVSHKGSWAKPSHLRISVKVDVDADIQEFDAPRALGVQSIDMLNKSLANALRNRCLEAVRRSKALDVDSFQFGRHVRSHMRLADFENLHWPQVYRSTEVAVSVTAHVRRSGGLFGNVATTTGR